VAAQPIGRAALRGAGGARPRAPHGAHPPPASSLAGPNCRWYDTDKSGAIELQELQVRTGMAAAGLAAGALAVCWGMPMPSAASCSIPPASCLPLPPDGAHRRAPHTAPAAPPVRPGPAGWQERARGCGGRGKPHACRRRGGPRRARPRGLQQVGRGAGGVGAGWGAGGWGAGARGGQQPTGQEAGACPPGAAFRGWLKGAVRAAGQLHRLHPSNAHCHSHGCHAPPPSPPRPGAGGRPPW
jgi:hypothetical protein